MKSDNSKRLTILTTEEINKIYSIPVFNKDEKKIYFTLNAKELLLINSIKSTPSKINLIINIGYFKAKQMIYNFTFDDVESDINYIVDIFFPMYKNKKINISPRIDRYNKIKTLDLFNYTISDTETKKTIKTHALQLVKTHKDPRSILFNLIDYCNMKNLLFPKYSIVQTLISEIMLIEKKRVGKIISDRLNKEEKKLIRSLLEHKDKHVNLKNLLKEPNDFSLNKILDEINKKLIIQPLLCLSHTLIPSLDISIEKIKHYSSMVGYIASNKLRGIEFNQAALYCMCFLYERNLKLNDNLVDAFIYKINQYDKTIKENVVVKTYQTKQSSNNKLRKVGKILQILIEKKKGKHKSFKKFKEDAFKILSEEELCAMVQYLSDAGLDEIAYYWGDVKTITNSMKKYIRPILKNVNIRSVLNNNLLLEGLLFLNKTYDLNLKEIDKKEKIINIIDKKIRKYFIYNTKTKSIDYSKLEFHIYVLVKQQIESGELYIKKSNKYQSFDAGLYPQKVWDKSKNVPAKRGAYQLGAVSKTAII